MARYVGRLLIGLIAAAGLCSAWGADGDGASVVVDAASERSAGGDYFVATVNGDGLQGTNGYHLALRFDREALEYVEFRPGTLFEKCEVFGPYFERWPDVVDLTIGTAMPNPTAVDAASLGAVVFRVLDSKGASVELEGFHLADSTWNPVTVIDAAVGKRGETVALPSYRFGLGETVPNPANPSMVVRFEVAVESEVEIAVYDVSGRRCRTLVAGIMSAGAHEVEWDGRSESGREVGSGVYFLRMQAGAFEATRKAMLVR